MSSGLTFLRNTRLAELPLRDRKKVIASRAIVQSAEDLVRLHGDCNFSVEELADRANVSVKTIYNYFGSKSAIMYGVMRKVAFEQRSPFLPSSAVMHETILQFTEEAVAAIVRERRLYHAVNASYSGWYGRDESAELYRMGVAAWLRLLRNADSAEKVVPQRVTAELLASNLRSTLELWLQGTHSDAAFDLSAQIGSLHVILMSSPASDRATIINHAADLVSRRDQLNR